MSFIFDIAAARQAGAIGKYNQQIQERNAQIAEQESEQLEKQKELDLQKFDQQFQQLEGETRVAFATSGVELSGSALNILRSNAEQAELERDIIEYNTEIGKSQKLEEANFARMQGTLARAEAKQAQLGYYARAGESLLKFNQS